MKRSIPSIDYKLFRKAIVNSLSPEEQSEFDNWLNSNYKNRAYFEKAVAFYTAQITPESIPEEELRSAWANFKRYSQPKGGIRPVLWLRVAASVAVIALVSYLLFSVINQHEARMANNPAETRIKPGKSIARLTLDDGQVMWLENRDTTISLPGTQTMIAIDSGRVNYNDGKDDQSRDFRINKIEIPHGGEYYIRLGDGTAVWLNSESSLEYRVPFAPGKREVTLVGEAYFEVAHDPSRPFVVKTRQMNARVLGTSFNISSYPGDTRTLTTLVTGKVLVDDIKGREGDSFILEPAQQLVFDKVSMEAEMRTVDTSVYTAWMNGSFVFEDEKLADIFQKLQRWYDIEVFFKSDDIKNELYTGKLPKFQDFQVIVGLLDKVGKAKIEIDGNTVIVK